MPLILTLLLLNSDNLGKSFGRLKESVQMGADADAPSFWLETKQQVVMVPAAAGKRAFLSSLACILKSNKSQIELNAFQQSPS